MCVSLYLYKFKQGSDWKKVAPSLVLLRPQLSARVENQWSQEIFYSSKIKTVRAGKDFRKLRKLNPLMLQRSMQAQKDKIFSLSSDLPNSSQGPFCHSGALSACNARVGQQWSSLPLKGCITESRGRSRSKGPQPEQVSPEEWLLIQRGQGALRHHSFAQTPVCWARGSIPELPWTPLEAPTAKHRPLDPRLLLILQGPPFAYIAPSLRMNKKWPLS